MDLKGEFRSGHQIIWSCSIPAKPLPQDADKEIVWKHTLNIFIMELSSSFIYTLSIFKTKRSIISFTLISCLTCTTAYFWVSSKPKISILSSYSEFCSIQGYKYLHMHVHVFMFLKLNKYATPNFLFRFRFKNRTVWISSDKNQNKTLQSIKVDMTKQDVW